MLWDAQVVGLPNFARRNHIYYRYQRAVRQVYAWEKVSDCVHQYVKQKYPDPPDWTSTRQAAWYEVNWAHRRAYGGAVGTGGKAPQGVLEKVRGECEDGQEAEARVADGVRAVLDRHLW